jgi:hypothetical protein
VRQRVFTHVWAQGDGILCVSVFDRDGQMADLPRDENFQGLRLGFGAKAARE